MDLGIINQPQQLVTLIENIQQASDNNLHVVGIFLDLTKAYDVINHNTLLNELVIWGQRYCKLVVQIIFI
jgi:hypothetical protein